MQQEEDYSNQKIIVRSEEVGWPKLILDSSVGIANGKADRCGSSKMVPEISISDKKSKPK